MSHAIPVAPPLPPAPLFDTLRERALAARAAGQLAQAGDLYAQALAIDPNEAQCHFEYGEVMLLLGERVKAFIHLQQAVHAIDSAAVRVLYAQTLSKMRFMATEPGLKRDLQHALDGCWLRPSDLAGVTVSVLRHEYAFEARAAAQAVTSGTGPVRDPLMLALIGNTPNTDPALERWLTAARATLLTVVSGHQPAHAAVLLPFAIAMARQAWMAEYVLPVSGPESQALAALQARLAAQVAVGEQPGELALAALACYQSLLAPAWHPLLWMEFSPAMNGLLTWHLRNPLRERLLAQHMPCVTAIADDVSRKVQAQYEEHPYPRWTAQGLHPSRVALRDVIVNNFPALAPQWPVTDDACEVLVAGCGTGQQPVATVSTLDHIRVLAVDLCLASLSYARRMCLAMGIGNIEFVQGDILELGALTRRFDMIECAGVLHHLGDPEQGWRVLRGLLRPHGVMVIALYSRIARADLQPARALVRELGIGATDDGIRRFRAHVQTLPDDHPCKKLLLRRDFYTISSLRDLVFHANEHEYDLEQIGAMAGRLGLKLLRLDAAPESLKQFQEFFGGQRQPDDLAAWHEFEQRHPLTFRGMYQMWFCQA